MSRPTMGRLSLGGAAMGMALIANAIANGGEPVDFHREIRPLLADKCLRCHGPDAAHREADLRLDVPPAAGDSQAIVPGEAAASELIRRVRSRDPHVMMPPPKSGKTLTAAEIAALTRWIDEGAKHSPHWAYVPPVRREPPSDVGTEWSRTVIDAFLAARWRREKMSPAADADPVTLIRRLSFDLRGLPPSVEEVEAFLQDRQANAWERLVDRFLSEEATAERLASYWLDLVRFADTVGYHGDQEHHISPYRDWVIDAFDSDMPFDQFSREQLAGDLAPNASVDQKIASGYNRLLQTSHEGGVQRKEYLAMYAADRVRNLSGVWFGATIGCAQCHDHKFDPYSQKDFYALSAFFADLDEDAHLRKGSDSNPTVRAPELKVHTRRERETLARLTAEERRLASEIAAAERDLASAPAVAALKSTAERVSRERGALEKAARLTMISVAIEPRVVRVLPRGNWLDESGAVVEPAAPAFLGRVEAGSRRANRLDLANWLTDGKSGAGLLTARVMVNRYWSLMFGSGLCRSLEDFGAQGEPPDHPELLDRLAWDFVENGWRTKPLLKQMAMSRAYRLSSTEGAAAVRERDPENRLFARQGRFRLPAEMIRDNALAISGLLVREIGGASVRPYQPEKYYQHLNFPKRDYKPDADRRQWRRGVYVHWQRQFLHPMLKAFDAPRREECVPQRSRSNTPLAALTLLNDPTFVEAARVFAARIAHFGKTDEERLELAFKTSVSRPPDEFERAALLALLESSRREFGDDRDGAKALVSVGLTAPPDTPDVVETAAWTTVVRAVLNLSETVTRP